MRRDVFQAIADPTRRAIIQQISQEPMNLNAVAGRFDMSRQAISKHIQILVECELVRIRQQGRERFCEAQLEKLNEVDEWVAQYRRHWQGRLDALSSYLVDLQANSNKNP
ncbi:transcriptional regulator [Pedobacter yulinensis]|uniref:Transcriptional regulator n=1 Tax=Pedobacter yulinensis TaxID=2126353 RepID=A0A2T3HJM3_9SPHI|nr:metalloregulator ArsR/SmtB family transcription factor [Pedobacter yulinensis]PST82593.1 transcriptional regulator [Pedobacter yulinensis]